MVASLTSQFAQAVQLRAGSDGFHLHLPPVEIEWADVWESLQGLLGGHRWPRKGRPPGIPLTLWAGVRSLELHQLQALATPIAPSSSQPLAGGNHLSFNGCGSGSTGVFCGA
ncbi:MAG: hypothetical protein HC818_08060, partial [Synechococcaceae cyanobacterium RM1_1_27]|nr:hypothetical protein [Synechococcaceae cyanobacterium RM1_1_27]